MIESTTTKRKAKAYGAASEGRQHTGSDTETEAGHHRGQWTRARGVFHPAPAETEAHHHLETTTRIDYLFIAIHPPLLPILLYGGAQGAALIVTG